MKKLKPYIYLGERCGPFGIQQVFADKKGKQITFRGVKGIWVGSCYGVTKEGVMLTRPTPIEPKPFEINEQQNLDYELHKEICKNYRAQKRKAMMLKQPHPDIVSAIALLRPFVRNSDIYTIKRFTDYLANQLSKRQVKK
jgi:hypothetical protein